MEEGPEPHELIEQTVEHHHHEHGDAGPQPSRSTMQAALTAAILAVLAAISSLLSGHSANEALIEQTQSADKWAEYQAKSVKGHMYAVNGDMLSALALSPEAMGRAGPTLKRFEEQARKYDREKQGLQEEAAHLQESSVHSLQKHKDYAFGVVAFQVGIVFASISMLVRSQLVYRMSWLAGMLGAAAVVFGALA